MAMYNPPHPGEVIREEILAPLSLSVSQLAQHFWVSQQALSVILNSRGPVTPELAYRLSLLFKPSAESWLRQQVAYDLWQVRQHSANIHVTPVKA
jgi:addiction module HigA family antidote